MEEKQRVYGGFIIGSGVKRLTQEQIEAVNEYLKTLDGWNQPQPELKIPDVTEVLSSLDNYIPNKEKFRRYCSKLRGNYGKRKDY